MTNQLELFADAPFCLRLNIEDAMRIFWNNYWQYLPSAKATTAHRSRILQFFRNRFIDTISKHDIEAMRRDLKEKFYSDATINKAHMILGRMFNKLQEYKEAGEVNGIDFRRVQIPHVNPCERVPKVSERPYARKTICTEKQFKDLLYYCDDDMTDKIIMLVDTGLRPCDLGRITDKNVDLKRNVLSGIQNKTITTRNPSGVPYLIKITNRCKDIISGRLARVKPGTPLFPTNGWQKKWDIVRERAGCRHIQRRDLRRTKGSFLLDNGTDARTVADSLGLTTLRMLPTYTPRTLQHQVEGLEKLVKAYS